MPLEYRMCPIPSGPKIGRPKRDRKKINAARRASRK
jgi:hypothetical protein